jgi:hypothetical protein
MLSELPGIGTDLAAKIKKIAESGHCSLLGRLHTELLPERLPNWGQNALKRCITIFWKRVFGFAGQRIRAA